MSDGSKIEWTEASWNPVTGCVEVSPGCDHCYAKTFAERWRGTPGHHFKHGFDLTLRPERLDQPLRWTRPRRIFVNSMSDLFLDGIPDEYIAQVFAVMALTARHTFQLLTKRHGRMRALLSSDEFRAAVAEHATDIIGRTGRRRQLDLGGQSLAGDSGRGGVWTVERIGTEQTGVFTLTTNLWSPPWPLPNVWLGVSVETQKWADIRIPVLLDTPAVVRWLSCEPLLGPVDLHNCGGVDALERDWAGGPGGGTGAPHPFIDWVVAGGESGPGARPMHPAWVRSLRDQCEAAEVPYFLKQWGAWAPAERETATHLLQVDGKLVDRRDATMDHPYGARSGLAQDLVDRGHAGWERVRRVPKNAAGRDLDGRTHDEYPREREAVHT